MGSPEASKRSILHHLRIIDRILNPFGVPTMDEHNNNIDEAIKRFQKVLNHPNTDRIYLVPPHGRWRIWLKDDFTDFIDILKERKEDFRNGIFDLREADDVIAELNGDLETVMERFEEQLEIQHRFNNVDKYEGFEEALVAIGSKRHKKSRKPKSHRRKSRKPKSHRRKSRKPKRHRKRRKTRRRRKM